MRRRGAFGAGVALGVLGGLGVAVGAALLEMREQARMGADVKWAMLTLTGPRRAS